MSAAGTFAEEPIFTSTNEGGRFLDVRFERSLQLWPWSGFLALYIRVTQEGSQYQVQWLFCLLRQCWFNIDTDLAITGHHGHVQARP